MEIIWHYTTGIHMIWILRDRKLKVSETERMLRLKPAVWFSRNQTCEPTALKGKIVDGTFVKLDMKEQSEAMGLYRIGIKFTKGLISWAKYKHVSKIDPTLYDELGQTGITNGADPNQWYCSFKNIPESEWISIERFDGNKWENVLPEGFK